MKWAIKLKCGNCEDGLVAYLNADGPDDNVTEGYECLDSNGKGYTEHTVLYESADDLHDDYNKDDIISYCVQVC